MGAFSGEGWVKCQEPLRWGLYPPHPTGRLDAALGSVSVHRRIPWSHTNTAPSQCSTLSARGHTPGIRPLEGRYKGSRDSPLQQEVGEIWQEILGCVTCGHCFIPQAPWPTDSPVMLSVFCKCCQGTKQNLTISIAWA